MNKEEETKTHGFFHRLEGSLIITIIGIILLFSTAITVTLIAPKYIDPAWTQPSSYYQVQMYEVADHHLYVGRPSSAASTLQFVYRLIDGISLLAFVETENVRIVAPSDLQHYVTRYQETELKLTSRLLLLRKPDPSQKSVQGEFNGYQAAEDLRKQLGFRKDQELDKSLKVDYQILELYQPDKKEAFSFAETDGVMDNFIDDHFSILDKNDRIPFHKDPGVIFVKNPQEYLVSRYQMDGEEEWRQDRNGQPIRNVNELRDKPFRFLSRSELIQLGEDIFTKEGCWYCHTDQTRTLVQDVVLNGSESYPAPPSSPNEYIYQKVTFAGTRRIGPDLSRVGVKRPSRDWHKSHFWSPKTESAGTIMPSFRHFFDDDPRGTAKSPIGIPNYRFEAIFQYLMTKGTRITPPTQAWWIGKDPVQTLEIIDGQKKSG